MRKALECLVDILFLLVLTLLLLALALVLSAMGFLLLSIILDIGRALL